MIQTPCIAPLCLDSNQKKRVMICFEILRVWWAVKYVVMAFIVGSKMIKEISKLHKKSSEIYQSANLVPDQVWKITDSVPGIFSIT
jgi:hypothetical protein